MQNFVHGQNVDWLPEMIAPLQRKIIRGTATEAEVFIHSQLYEMWIRWKNIPT